MAETQGWARRAVSRMNPLTRIREGASNFAAHPVQNSVSALLGLAGSAFGGPLAGQALRRGSNALFDRGNDRRFDRGAAELQQGSQAAIGGGVDWSVNPSGRYAQSGMQGMQGGGMPGITSPYTPQSPQQQSQLAQLLGLPDYAGGNNGNLPSGPSAPTDNAAPTLPAVSVTPPSNRNITSGGARDAFASNGGSDDWMNTFASLAMQGSQGGSTNTMGGPTAVADSLQGRSALQARLRDQLSQDPNNEAALNLRAQMIANRGGGR